MLRSLKIAVAAGMLLVFVGTLGLTAQQPAAKKKSSSLRAAKRRSYNNLRQLALGMQNMHDVLDQFPPIRSRLKDGKPLYSWRVDILPYVEEDQLYKQFHWMEPWDSEHNKKLLDRMPKIFAPVTGRPAEKNTTHYQMIVGGGAILDSYQKKNRMADIKDGPANTFMIVEAEEPVLWTKPEDLVYDPEKPLPKFGGHFKDGFYAAFADGTVRFIKKGTDEKVLRALITRAGGEKVNLGALK